MAKHTLKVLAHGLTGDLMSVDIDDVLVGDVMFVGGHLARRVWTKPCERTVGEYRLWQGLRLHDPADGVVYRRQFQTAIGRGCLILRPVILDCACGTPTYQQE